MFLTNLFKTKKVDEVDEKRTAINRYLMRREAEIGGTLFGAVPKGVRREFFCLDPHTWIWHEEWPDKNGGRKVRTTRYNIRSNAILKAQDNSGFHLVSLEEADHLMAAINAYEKRVKQELYQDVIA